MKRIAVFLFAAFAALVTWALPSLAQAGDDRAGILILGDSNSEGPFGLTLYDALRSMRDPVGGKKLNVAIYAKCGAGARDWINRDYAKIICTAWECSNDRILAECEHFNGGETPTLQELYDNLDAARKVTLVALGLNMLGYGSDIHMDEAAQLIAAIKKAGSACVWVGPPQAGAKFFPLIGQARFLAALKDTVIKNGCQFIDSTDKTDRADIPEKEDHYPEDKAIAWANRVLEELRNPLTPGDRSLNQLLGAKR